MDGIRGPGARDGTGSGLDLCIFPRHVRRASRQLGARGMQIWIVHEELGDEAIRGTDAGAMTVRSE
jgi:hypothetical protein